MLRPTSSVALLFSLVFALPAAPSTLVAQAGDSARRWTLRVSGPATNTPVTGAANPIETLRGPANSVLTNMEFFERSDRPCQVRATFSTWDFDAQDRAVDVSETVRIFDGCEGNSGSRKTISVGAPTGFWALRACLRRQNDRLKGLEAKRVVLGREGGTLSGVSYGQTAWDRPNCNEWEGDFVECAGGRVARGLLVAHETDPAVITGLALDCAFVEGRLSPGSSGIIGATAGGRRGSGRAGTGAQGEGATTLAWTSPSWTSVSGETASNSDVLSFSSPLAIKGVSIFEQGDQPYMVWGYSETLCVGVCPDGPGGAGQSIVTDADGIRGLGGFGQKIELSLDDDHYVTAMQVCTSGQNNRDRRRIKGLRIWGARIGADGQLIGSSEMQEGTRANCSQWYPRLECPAGKVAVALRGYYDGRRNDPWFTGLAIQCGRVS